MSAPKRPRLDEDITAERTHHSGAILPVEPQVRSGINLRSRFVPSRSLNARSAARSSPPPPPRPVRPTTERPGPSAARPSAEGTKGRTSAAGTEGTRPTTERPGTSGLKNSAIRKKAKVLPKEDPMEPGEKELAEIMKAVKDQPGEVWPGVEPREFLLSPELCDGCAQEFPPCPCGDGKSPCSPELLAFS